MNNTPNLPSLPTELDSVYVSVDGLNTYVEPRDCYYTMDQMYAYAEEAVHQALAAQVRTPPEVSNLPAFESPAVQAVYKLLCDDQQPPIGEHWEGFVARRIVQRLSAPVTGAIQWPTMPACKGQSPVLFEDGYAEGWAKCMDECRRAVWQASAPVAGEAQPSAWETDNVSPTKDRELADRWRKMGWTVRPLYTAPQASADARRLGF